MAYKIHEDINSVFTMNGPLGSFLGPDRKAIIRASLWAGGEFFRTERIPLRFTDFAYRLGYRVTDEWKKEKRNVLQSRRAFPFIGMTPPGGGDAGSLKAKVINAEKLATAMARGCRTDITGTSKGGNILIRTPYGHPILAVFAQVFQTVTPDEYQEVARVVAASLNEFLAYGRKVSKRSKKMTIRGASDNWKPRGREYAARDNGTLGHR